MGKERLIWVDSLKGILILLVVLGHAIQNTLGEVCDTNHLWNIIYSFHMPAFMAISGYLAFRPSITWGGRFWNVIYRRFRQLMIPFISWTLISLLLNNSFTLADVGSYLLYPDIGLWFLWALFFITLIFNYGSWLSEKTKVSHEIVIGAFCILLTAVMVLFDIRVFGFQFIAYYFIMYSFGYYLNKYHDKFVTDKPLLIGMFSMVWAVMAWFWQMHEIPVLLQQIPFPKTLLQYAYRFLTAAIAIYVLIAISPKTLNSITNWNKAFVSYGTVSLGIYTVHLIPIGSIVRLSKSYIASAELVIVLSFICGAAFSYLIVWILSKWTVTEKLLLGKI